VRKQRHLLALSWPQGLRLAAQVRRQPRETFYCANGVGDEEIRACFLQDDHAVSLGYGRSLQAFDLDAGLHYRSTVVDSGHTDFAHSLMGLFAEGELPGLGNRAGFLEAGLAIRGSWVDRPGSPTRGNRTRLSLGYARSLNGPLSHLSAQAFSEQYLELFCQRTISLGLGTMWTWAPGTDRVPFYRLASLGGSDVLRGYRRGRFRDQGAVFGILAYRFPICRVVKHSSTRGGKRFTLRVNSLAKGGGHPVEAA
jgi:hypothetical protein